MNSNSIEIRLKFPITTNQPTTSPNPKQTVSFFLWVYYTKRAFFFNIARDIEEKNTQTDRQTDEEKEIGQLIWSLFWFYFYILNTMFIFNFVYLPLKIYGIQWILQHTTTEILKKYKSNNCNSTPTSNNNNNLKHHNQ